MSEQHGRVALVTGASRGIGRAVAIRLGALGYRVAVNYQSSEAAAKETAEVIRGAGGTAFTAQADISDQDEAKGLLEAVAKELGPVEVLVCNAGITRDNLLIRMKPTEWNDVIRTNLSSVYYCTQAAIRGMIKTRFGRIVAMSSVAGLAGNPGQANYAAAKAGILGLVKSIAREVASRGITANAVAPGYVDTDMTSSLPVDVKEGIIRQIPIGRYGMPEDVAHAVAYLVSDEAAYVTGQVIAVDGGMTMQ
ncbi:MAG: 3-oxoacyl-[acyl-carrier-protein] reductase [Synergistaceae bacterium]|jgi:3-oxoacyl-[acyl-carrier protein] reductase|nr:3-oxoacyl-[acyl-carrier-protein] reductase [Synergistaceae bacterium]